LKVVNVIGVILDDEVLDRSALRLALRTRLNKYVGHGDLPVSITKKSPHRAKVPAPSGTRSAVVA
jgi:hypothetical protein